MTELKPAASVSKVRCWLEGKWFVVSGSWSVWCYPGYCNLQESFTHGLPGNAKHWALHLKINSCVCGSLSRLKKKKPFGCMPRTWGPPCLRQLKSQCTLNRVYLKWHVLWPKLFAAQHRFAFFHVQIMFFSLISITSVNNQQLLDMIHVGSTSCSYPSPRLSSFLSFL